VNGSHRKRTFTALACALFAVLALYACSPDHTPEISRTYTDHTSTPARLTSTSVTAPLTATPRHTSTPAATVTRTEHPTPDPAPVIKQGYGITVKGVNYGDDSLEKAISLQFEWIKIYDHPHQSGCRSKYCIASICLALTRTGPSGDTIVISMQNCTRAALTPTRSATSPTWSRNGVAPLTRQHMPPCCKSPTARSNPPIPTPWSSAPGLAPVGHGAELMYLNDLDFLQSMYEHGAGDYFDVLAVHPFGFAYPPEMPVDGQICTPNDPQDGPILDRGCWSIEGFCFRRAEQARAIMTEYGDTDKPVWATEFGWIIRPPTCCLAQADWTGRAWQVVSERQQARYILRAFAYAKLA